MKPRHVVAAVTDEDLRIWWQVIARLPTPPSDVPTLFYSSVQGDRRDASIMLVLGWWRVKKFARRWRFAAEAAEFPGLHADGDSWWSGARLT